ncbi:DNA-processing protein DprA [Candidatus Albibeggiatoa sp. nov. NOAA]|uniref:DNA-processing protein DprA n=1 Tax=Candidatus Albibeggiatoa sp. nov. NOAA TaxID=3162724 RepID=UPI0033017BBD|nr:DNA-processing protein DprA [Thiotrichaceae bacterium]
MSIENLKYWLALSRAPQIGAVTFGQLLKRFGSPEMVFLATQRDWLNAGLKNKTVDYLQHPDWDAIEADLNWSQQTNNHLLTLDHPQYPAYLREVHGAPPILYAHGQLDILQIPQVAIVGTRHPSQQGYEIAKEFASHIAQAGFVITSGLAKGIDEAAHWGAVAVNGKTIAVTGTGLDRVYPAQNYQLAHTIAQTGLLLSEFPLKTPPHSENFPRRNRIISSITLGTLVIEANVRSGSLITARLAAEQGREVFAIPGSIQNKLARGCHALIKEGAKLVESANDVIEELLIHIPVDGINSTPLANKAFHEIPATATTSSNKLDELDPQYKTLYDCMGFNPISIDDLVDVSQLSVEEVSSMLLILELQGLVSSQAGGLYVRN